MILQPCKLQTFRKQTNTYPANTGRAGIRHLFKTKNSSHETNKSEDVSLHNCNRRGRGFCLFSITGSIACQCPGSKHTDWLSNISLEGNDRKGLYSNFKKDGSAGIPVGGDVFSA